MNEDVRRKILVRKWMEWLRSVKAKRAALFSYCWEWEQDLSEDV